MTKLVSRNPVQRFKEGRKIVKAYDGTYLGIPVHKYQSTEGIKYGYRDPKTGKQNSVTADKLDTGRKYSTGTMRGMVYIGADGNMYQNGRRGQIRQEKKVEKKLVSTDDTKSSKSDKAAGRGTATPVVKSTPTSFMGQGIQQGWRGTAGDISGVTEAQRQQLINSGRFTMDDFKNAGTLQAALNRELSGLGKGSISVDNKWGSQSQKALQAALIGLPAISPTPLPENSAALQMTPKPITYTVNNLSGTTGNTSVLGGTYTPGVSVNGVSTIQNSIQNMNLPTYNRRGVRNYLRAKGFNPYSFSGAQRRALRMTLNNTGNSTDSDIVQGMGLFKKGGLISRNPVKQFKVNFRKEAL